MRHTVSQQLNEFRPKSCSIVIKNKVKIEYAEYNVWKNGNWSKIHSPMKVNSF